MSLAKQYLEGLGKACGEKGVGEAWNKLCNTAWGAEEKELKKLQQKYPYVPESLLDLLRQIDGTYWREYGTETVTFYLLGSDLEKFPYYLLSAREMQEEDDMDWLEAYIEREFDEDDVVIDERIIDHFEDICWLHFSDCMNNGGTSQLFIDFSPSPKGKVGQIVRYLHDPDELTVIADNFDEYLQMLMDLEYDFICEDDIDIL